MWHEKMLGKGKKCTLLALILLVALLLRVWGIAYDLPYIRHPDEPVYVTISQTIFKTGDLNPHFFNYPSLFFYINALAYVPYYLLGKLFGLFATREDILYPVSLAMGVTQSPMPTSILLGRLVTLTFGVGAVGLTFLVGKELRRSAWIGGLAAFMVAVSSTNVNHSRLITPDTFVVFFALAAALAATWIYRHGKAWHYAAAGLCIGLTASSKYNGGLIIVAPMLAHFLRCGPEGWRSAKLYLVLLCTAAGFLATTPYALLDGTRFLADLQFERQHYATGHAGMEGNALSWYLGYMASTAGILYALAAVEMVRGLYRRSCPILLLAAFPAAYFVFISSFTVRNDRTLLPLTPFLFLLAASFLVYLFQKAAAWQPGPRRRTGLFATTLLCAAGLGVPLAHTVHDTAQLGAVDNREIAEMWISENLPAGAHVAIESYAPFVEPSRYTVQGFGKMIDHEPSWYREGGFGYLVFSERMYWRFYHEPEKYPLEVSQYNRFFEQFRLLQQFSGADADIRVYAVEPVPTPTSIIDNR